MDLCKAEKSTIPTSNPISNSFQIRSRGLKRKCLKNERLIGRRFKKNAEDMLSEMESKYALQKESMQSIQRKYLNTRTELQSKEKDIVQELGAKGIVIEDPQLDVAKTFHAVVKKKSRKKTLESSDLQHKVDSKNDGNSEAAVNEPQREEKKVDQEESESGDKLDSIGDSKCHCDTQSKSEAVEEMDPMLLRVKEEDYLLYQVEKFLQEEIPLEIDKECDSQEQSIQHQVKSHEEHYIPPTFAQVFGT